MKNTIKFRKQTYRVQDGKLVEVEGKPLFTHKYSENDYAEILKRHYAVLKEIDTGFTEISHKLILRMIRIDLENIKNSIEKYFSTSSTRINAHADKLFIGSYKNLMGRLRNNDATQEIIVKNIKAKLDLLLKEFEAQREYINKENKNAAATASENRSK